MAKDFQPSLFGALDEEGAAPSIARLPGKSQKDGSALQVRQDLLHQKRTLKEDAKSLEKEARQHPVNSPERNWVYKRIQANLEQQELLEGLLTNDFLPQHSPQQLISPRAFFASALFRVCSKRLEREREHTVEALGPGGVRLFRYTGPELRQSDGLVFMALLNIARDAKLGAPVTFPAESLCKTVFQRYDGPARSQLKEHIKRLQRGLIETGSFSVQLCQRFDYPSKGLWSVTLDKDIVELFKQSTQVWLDLPTRQALPEGLTTWLYSFIESQTRLIPTSVSSLRTLCGSDASEESFPRTLRIALKELNKHGILDAGWSIRGGTLFWRKAEELRAGSASVAPVSQ